MLSSLLTAIPGHLQSAARCSGVGHPVFFRAYRLTRGQELPQTLPDDKTEMFYALSLLFLDFSRVLDVGGNCGLGTADRRTIVLSVCFHDYFIL
jgi:hypothetical protein